jgi:hypothetical protein
MRALRALRLLLFLTCREAAPMLSRAMDRPPAGPERAALRVHLWICPSCRRYRAQLGLVRSVLARCRAGMLQVCLRPLPEAARARIRLGLTRGATGR